MNRDEVLASLSEGICPLCHTKLDKNRVCAAGAQWNIKEGIELAGNRHYEGPDPTPHPCCCPNCVALRESQVFKVYKTYLTDGANLPRPPIDIDLDYESVEKLLIGKEIKVTFDMQDNATEKLQRLYQEIQTDYYIDPHGD